MKILKPFAFFCIYITFSGISFSQSETDKTPPQLVDKGIPKIDVSEPYSQEYYSKYFASNNIFEIDNRILNIRARGGAVWHNKLEIRLSDPQTGATINYTEHNIDPREVYIERTIMLGNKVYLFYSEYSQAQNKESLNAFIISLEDNKIVINDKLKITEVDGKVKTDSEYNPGTISFTNAGKFEIKLNKNFNRFIASYSRKLSSLSSDNISFATFNSELDKIWENDIKLPSNFLTFVDYTIDKDNNILAILKDKAVTISTKRDVFSLMKVKPTNEVTFQEIKVDDFFIEDIKLQYNVNNQLYILGYYRTEIKKPIKGLFSMEYSLNDNISKPIYNNFSFNLAVQYKKLSASKKSKLKRKFLDNDYGIYRLSIHSIKCLSDGSFAIIGIQQSSSWNNSSGRSSGGFMVNSSGAPMSTTQNFSGGSSSSTLYKDLVVTKLSTPNQESSWSSKIPRNEYSNELFIGNNEEYLYFIFPDNPKNKNLTDNTSVYVDKTSLYNSLCAYQVNIQNGEKARYQISNNGDIANQKAGKINASSMKLLSSGDIVIELALKKDIFRYFKIRF